MEIANTQAVRKTGRRTNAAGRWEEQSRLVKLVVTAYRAVKELPPLVAMNCDLSPQSRSCRWSPDSAHYGIDIENTVRRVIQAKSEAERPTLWTAWKNLLVDPDRIGKDEQRLIRLLAGPLYTKKLHPGLYFRRNEQCQ